MFDFFQFDFQPLLCISKMWRWFMMFHNNKTIIYMGSHQCMWWSTWSLWRLMIALDYKCPNVPTQKVHLLLLLFLEGMVLYVHFLKHEICKTRKIWCQTNLIQLQFFFWMLCNCPWLICHNLSCHKFALEFQLTTLAKTSFVTFENCHLFFKQEQQHTTTLKYLC
jgi:hypothetical protein